MSKISADASAAPKTEPAQQKSPQDAPAKPYTQWILPGKKLGRPLKSDSQKPRAVKKAENLSKRELLVQRVRPAFEKYCLAIANGARAREALAIANVPYGDIQHGCNHSAELKQMLEDAKAYREQQRIEERHDEINHRAVNGYEEPMVSAGRKVCTRVVRSDRLLELLYKCDHPELFTHKIENNVNITARTITELVAEIESKTPIGTTRPTVFIGSGEAKRLTDGAIDADPDESEQPPSEEE